MKRLIGYFALGLWLLVASGGMLFIHHATAHGSHVPVEADGQLHSKVHNHCHGCCGHSEHDSPEPMESDHDCTVCSVMKATVAVDGADAFIKVEPLRFRETISCFDEIIKQHADHADQARGPPLM